MNCGRVVTIGHGATRVRGRIPDRHTDRFQVPNVAGYHGQAVLEGGGCNQEVGAFVSEIVGE